MFASNSKHRVQVTPAKRGKGNTLKVPNEIQDQTPAERRASMTWAQRLKRVFNIDADKSAGQPICTAVDCREAVGHKDVTDETCRECGGVVNVIACIEDPVVIAKILTHLNRKAA